MDVVHQRRPFMQAPTRLRRVHHVREVDVFHAAPQVSSPPRILGRSSPAIDPIGNLLLTVGNRGSYGAAGQLTARWGPGDCAEPRDTGGAGRCRVVRAAPSPPCARRRQGPHRCPHRVAGRSGRDPRAAGGAAQRAVRRLPLAGERRQRAQAVGGHLRVGARAAAGHRHAGDRPLGRLQPLAQRRRRGDRLARPGLGHLGRARGPRHGHGRRPGQRPAVREGPAPAPLHPDPGDAHRRERSGAVPLRQRDDPGRASDRRRDRGGPDRRDTRGRRGRLVPDRHARRGRRGARASPC